MDSARCEAVVNTVAQKIEFTENIEGIDEWPVSWPDGEVSYRLNDFSDDFSKRWQTIAVTVALRAWQLRIKNLKFRRERSSGVSVDINVAWKNLAHFDNKKGVLAHAFFPIENNDLGGDCHLNDEWDYVAGTHLSDMAHPPLVPILIHEFGHSLGLRHDTKIESQNTEIMYPSFNLGRKKNALGPRSVQRIQARYGARTLSQRIIDYFLNRRAMGIDFR